MRKHLSSAMPLMTVAALLALACFVPSIAMAQSASGGIAQVQSGLQTVITYMLLLGAGVTTIAIMWALYKMLVDHAHLMDVLKPVMAAVGIAFTPAFVAWLFSLTQGG